MRQNYSKLNPFFSRQASKINKKLKIALALLLFVIQGIFLSSDSQRPYESFIYYKKTYIIY